MHLIKDILNIIFPKVCCSCDRGLTRNEVLICFHCRSELPKTNMADAYDNELVNKFLGKLEINFGLAYLYFLKSGITQKLLHQLKYNNVPEIGELLGKWFGAEMNRHELTGKINLIVPVPLHPKKQRKRGYNQSDHFAKGISEITNIPIDFESLKRILYSRSQTIKTKEQRWKSVEHAFQISDDKLIRNKNVLLVDDVITTGATLEACGHQILNCGAKILSIATIAIAK